MSEINRLIQNIARGTTGAHAYIVEGTPGEARDRFVLDFIKGLNCQCDDPGMRPCGSCPSCRQIDAGTSMDVFHMARSGKTGYRTADAADFTERLGMGAYGRHLIGVIDEADLLGETVQNKLLKTLEEPEAGTVIILATTNRDNLLKTVRSRCSVLRVSDYVAHSEEQGEPDPRITETAELLLSGGFFYSFRNAVDKKIKSREDAAEMLTAAEDMCRDNMVAGSNVGIMVQTIELIEVARMDLYRGMDYGKVLRRLFLELA